MQFRNFVVEYDSEQHIRKGDDSLNEKIDMIESGKNLRRVRGIMTRSGVSRETGIAYSSLQAYEEGRRCPSGKVKEQLANFYHCKVEDIFLPVNTTKRSE